MRVFVAGVPSSLAPRTPFFSRVLAPLPLSRLSLLRRLQVLRYIPYKAEITVVNYANFSTYALHFEL